MASSPLNEEFRSPWVPASCWVAWESDHIPKPQIPTEKARSACLTVLLQGLGEKHLEYYSPVAQSCLTLCYPMDCSPPKLLCPWNSPDKNTGVGSHSLFWESSQTRDQIQVSCIASRFFTIRATREAQRVSKGLSKIGHGRILGVMKTFCILSVTVVT